MTDSQVSANRAIAFVMDEPAIAAAHADSVDAWWLYASEVLDHLRLPYRTLPLCDDMTVTDDVGVLVMTRWPHLGSRAGHRVEQWVRAGGALIVVGGPGSLTDPLGVSATSNLVGHEHVDVHDHEAWTSRPDVPLHAIGGVRLAATATNVDVLASWADGAPALTSRRVGAGLAICSGVDIWQTIVRIQQGYPVTSDGEPAPTDPRRSTTVSSSARTVWHSTSSATAHCHLISLRVRMDTSL